MLIDGVNFTDDEYREAFGDPGPGRPDFESRGYRDNYPDAVQDVPGYDYGTGQYAASGNPEQDVANWLRSRGVSEHVIADEASYFANHYGDDWMTGAQNGLEHMLVRSAPNRATPNGPEAVGEMSSYGSGSSNGVNLPKAPYNPWMKDFVAPDPAQLASNPVVQARLQMGTNAFERSAAASGTLRTGGFAQALSNYGQQVATDEYSKIYDRAMGEFMGAYGIFKENQTIPFGMSTDLYRLGQEDRRIDQSGGYLDLARSGQSFNQDRATRMDDFSMYQYGDSAYYDRLFRAAELGKP